MTAIVDVYVHGLAGSLKGSRRARAELVREVADHLDDATEAFARRGLSDEAAQRAAIEEFGRLAQVAPRLQETLAVLSSRRLGLVLMSALLPQPFLWDSGISLSSRIGSPAPPGAPSVGWLHAGIEVLGFAGLVTAVVAVVVTGIGNRWWSPGRRFAVITGGVTAVGSAALLLALGAAMLAREADPVLWACQALFLGLPLAAALATAHASIRAGRATLP